MRAVGARCEQANEGSNLYKIKSTEQTVQSYIIFTGSGMVNWWNRDKMANVAILDGSAFHSGKLFNPQGQCVLTYAGVFVYVCK